MAGQLSATDNAGMSGSICDHVPAMKKAFKEEGIPFPFAPGEMEDLIAYLHGGGPPPDVTKGAQMHGSENK